MWIDSFGRSFMWIVRFVRDSFVGSFFRGSCSLGHICAHSCASVGSFFLVPLVKFIGRIFRQVTLNKTSRFVVVT